MAAVLFISAIVGYFGIGLFLGCWWYDRNGDDYHPEEIWAPTSLITIFWPIWLVFMPFVLFIQWFYRPLPDRKRKRWR